ncbi:MAG: hypothetical protein HY979_00505 [Candidatus Magasanikbacteria bacterium]|nr:hypothetical protein [Candidatus Magasanikbacteria bacterium]
MVNYFVKVFSVIDCCLVIKIFSKQKSGTPPLFLLAVLVGVLSQEGGGHVGPFDV